MNPCFTEKEPSLYKRLTGHRGDVTGLSFHPDCNQLASSSNDSTLILWNFKKHAHAIKFENHSEQVTDVCFLPNAKMFASSSKDRTLRLWKPSIKSKSKVITAHTSAVRSVHASADSTVLLSASNDKNIKMWMSELNNKFVSSFKGHTHWVNCARFSIDGKHVVSCSDDKTVKLWDRHSNCLIHTFEEKVIPKYVEFHPNNKCVGVAFANGHVKIYDIRSHKLLQFYSVHKQAVNKIAFHPNGNFFISGSNDGLVKVYDVIEGHVIYTLEGHEGAVTAVTFSSDGSRFATSGVDKTVLVWNTNFHEERPARPMGKCSINSRPSEINLEGRSRTVDARLSFSAMEQPQVDVSSVLDSPLDEKREGFESSQSADSNILSTNDSITKKIPVNGIEKSLIQVETSNDRSHVNTVQQTTNGSGDVSDRSELENVKFQVEAIKMEVINIQKQLGKVMETLEAAEKRQQILENQIRQ